LGEQRREKRLIPVVESRSAQPPASIPGAAPGWRETKAAYRRLIYIADREDDWREWFDTGHELGYRADILVRARHQRNTAAGGKLWEKVENRQALGDIELVLPADQDRAAPRKVCQTRYVQRVKRSAKGKLPGIEVTGLLAREENPPAHCH
jgi:hypothetical protein